MISEARCDSNIKDDYANFLVSDLSLVEKRLLDKFILGEMLDLREGDSGADNPLVGDHWGSERQIRGEVVAALLLGAMDPPSGRVPRIELIGARIAGALNVRGGENCCAAEFLACYFDNAPVLNEAKTKTIAFVDSVLPGFAASFAKIHGHLALQNCSVNSGVWLSNAEITGQLMVDRTRLSNPDGYALAANNVAVGEMMNCKDLAAEGKVSLLSAQIGGELNLNGAQIRNAGTEALVVDLATIGGHLVCKQNFSANGEMRLMGAKIGGQLILSGARLSNPRGYALEAANALVGESMFCKGLMAEGEVRLPSAQITDQLNFNGAQLSNADEMALVADRATVGGHFFCGQGFKANGEVRLMGAKIGGQLVLNGAHLFNPNGYALCADYVAVGGEQLCCNESFTAEGMIGLSSAHIAGKLDLSGANLSNPNGYALGADNVAVGGSMYCRGLAAEGGIWLLGAQISGQLDFGGAQLSNTGETALNAQRLRADSLWLINGFSADGCVDLYRAYVETLYDEPERWGNKLQLYGFVYKELEPYRDAVKGVGLWKCLWVRYSSQFTLLAKSQGRLAWLARGKSEYYPQPYEQLAKYYYGLGHDQQARIVLLMKQRHHRQTQGLGGRVLGHMLDWLVGYGYFPGKAFLWMLICWAVGSIYFSYYPAEATYPDRTVLFHPTLYVLDLLLPIISFGQQNMWWSGGGGGQWIAAILILTGWVLSIAMVAGITRVLTRY